jgi:glycosyltransferase involved in cell wall biosynthesis
MKVLIFSLSYFPLIGGAEVAIKELTDRIPEIEWDMVTLRFDRSHPEFEKVGNVNVYRIGGGLGYLSKILFIPDAAAFAFVNRRKYDLFWLMMSYMVFPMSVSRILGVKTPYLLTLQDGDPFEHVFKRTRISIFKPLLTYGFRHAKKVQTISNYLATWARDMGFKGKVEVIPNGVDIQRFRNNSPKDFDSKNVTLVTTSRLVEKNGVGDVIESLKLLPDSVRLRILGTGELGRKLEARAKDLGLENRIDFLGAIPQSEIPKYLWVSDIFIRPSLSEGQGISFIEAMAAGLPVVATNVGGIPDFIRDEETGVFCNVRDLESIAEKIKLLMANGDLREKIKANSLSLVKERYDWDLIAKEMRDKVFGV